MPYFIKARIFNDDPNGGLNIRKILRHLDEIGRDHRREAAEERRGETVRQRETGRANVPRHDLREMHDHRPVVAAVKKRQPQLNDQQVRKRHRPRQPGERGIRRQEHRKRERDEQRAPANSIGQRPHHG